MNNHLTKKSSIEFLNTLFPTICDPKKMIAAIEKKFLENNEKYHWGFNESDLPARPNPLFLGGNETYILMPRLAGTNDKSSAQRTFDNLQMILSKDSLERNKGRLRCQDASRNNESDESKPSLRWVKLSIFGVNDFSVDDPKSSLRRDAGLEILAFLDYYSKNVNYLQRYLGDIVIDGCQFNWCEGENSLPCQVGVHVDEISTEPIVDRYNVGEAKNYVVKYIIDDIAC